MKNKRLRFFWFLLILSVSSSILANKNSSLLKEPTHYEGALYGWIANINGTTSSGQPVTISFKKIIEHLKFAFMGKLEARQGRWSILGDIIYLNIYADKASNITVPLSGGGSTTGAGNADVDLKSWVINLIGGYSIIDTQRIDSDLTFGLRYLELSGISKLRLDAAGRTGAIESSLAGKFWNVVMGLKGHAKLSPRWSIPYYIDGGLGESKYTWQAATGLRYAYPWGSVKLTYRYLTWKNKSDARLTRLTIKGPVLGVSYRF